MASPAPNNACRNPQDNRGGGGVLPNASAQHSGLWGWFEGAYSRAASAAESAYHDVAGAVDYGYHATTKEIESGYTVVSNELRTWIDSVPDHIAQATGSDQLRYWAAIALGEKSFEVGVGVGMVKNLADGVLGLLKMLKMFVLAGLYEQAHASSTVAGVAINPQTYLIAKAADLVIGAQMMEADQQARAMLNELEHLVANPGELLTALGQQYKEKWDRFRELSKDTKLSSRFEAGEIVGDVLMDIIMLIQLAEGAAKLLSKVPKLLAEAEKLATKVPEIAKAARELGTVKKLESIEDIAKDAKAIKDPIKTVSPQVGSSNGVPAVSEEVPSAATDDLPVRKGDPKSITHNVGKNTVTWIVDSDGNPLSASGTIKQSFSGAARSSAEAQAQIDAAASGIAGDQGGHLVGHRFVLNQGEKNLFPQEGNFNMAAFKTLENDYARFTAKGYQVDFVHTLGDFDPITGRPGSLSVYYDVTDTNGNLIDTFSDKFLNQPGQTYTRRAF